MRSTRLRKQLAALACLVVTALVFTAALAGAQPIARLRVIRHAPLLETPRADGFVLGTVDTGAELEVIARQGSWLQVLTPSGFRQARGWIQGSAIQLLTPLPEPGRPPKGEWHVRAFGTASPMFFTAKNSTETILGSATALFLGGGAQAVWPNGAFLLGSFEQMQKTGTRVLVSGSQVYTLPLADQVTLTPISVTVGYREYKNRLLAPYVGVGAGWYRLRETTPGQDAFTKAHVSGHFLAGVEKPLQSWLSVAGEFQWTSAPKILGESGLSAAQGEDDLGGVSLRVKIIVGR
jgi:hypothetical protein